MLRGEAAPWSHYNRQLMVRGRGKTRRYQESNITLRRYIEDKQVQVTEPKGRWEALSLSSKWGHWQHCMLHNLEHTNPLRANITNARVKDCDLSADATQSVKVSTEFSYHPVSFQSILLFRNLFASMIKWVFCSFKLFLKSKSNKVSYWRCRKKVHIKHNIHWSTTYSI